MNSFLYESSFSRFHCIRYNNSLMLSISDQIAIYLFIYISHTILLSILHITSYHPECNLEKKSIRRDAISNGTRYVSKILFQRFLALLHTMQYRINSNHTHPSVDSFMYNKAVSIKLLNKATRKNSSMLISWFILNQLILQYNTMFWKIMPTFSNGSTSNLYQ